MRFGIKTCRTTCLIRKRLLKKHITCYICLMAKTIISPYEGFQERFVSSNVDIAIGGGSMSSGKTLAALLTCAEPCLDGNFKAVLLRNNMTNIKAGGGLLDEGSALYAGFCDVRTSATPDIVFPSGARIDFNHTSDQTPEALIEKVKGWQYDMIYFDELTGFEWSTFGILMSRNRGSGKWTGKIRGTCNPMKSHWLRTYLDWYIGDDGDIIEERDGVVRYVYQNGETVEDLVWGSSKEEVYELCRENIDEAVYKQNKKTNKEVIKWEDFILSSVFYKGTISENKAIIGRDSGYIGKIGMMGQSRAKANMGGNWNIDPDIPFDMAIKPEVAARVLSNDSMRSEEKWITADLADFGTNNTLALVWYGFDVVDCLVLSKTTPEENASNIKVLATEHNVPFCNIIYDGTAARYMNGYIEEAIPFMSTLPPKGMYAMSASRLKDECYLRLCKMVNNGHITINEAVANKKYPIVSPNTGKVAYIPFKSEFLQECGVIFFEKMNNGKYRLPTKYEMKRKLGKGRSTDIIDAMSFRMYPCLDLEYGKEYEESVAKGFEIINENTRDEWYTGETIYSALAD